MSTDPICNERGVPESECPSHCRHATTDPNTWPAEAADPIRAGMMRGDARKWAQASDFSREFMSDLGYDPDDPTVAAALDAAEERLNRAEPDAGDVEALIRETFAAMRARNPRSDTESARSEFDHWLAAHDAEVRREERERIAQAIEAVRSPKGLSVAENGLYDHAARIARQEQRS